MKSKGEHLKQGKENELYAEFLLTTERKDAITWAVTALFYSAAHYGRAFLASSDPTTDINHYSFESFFVREWQAPPDIYKLYRRLKDHSESGRYDCKSFSEVDVRGFRHNYLIPFRDAVCSFLDVDPTSLA